VVDTEFAELLRHALLAAMHVGAPVLVVTFFVSLAMGLLQAATGIHETAVGLLPRLLVVGLSLVATLPWMLERMVDLFRAAAGGS
jgi:flagellar biosynthetic protein FliQ